MAKPLPPLNSLRAFEVASRHLSFQKAAAELHVTPSALSYQIRQLEDYLQTPLFERLNRSVVLTSAGVQLAPGIQDAFVTLHSAVSSLDEKKEQNILTISTGPALSAKWLSPRLSRFIEANPEIDIRIQASLHLADFQRDKIDAAIRFGSGNYPGLHCDCLADDVMLPLASSNYLAPFGGKLKEQDLPHTTLLHDESTQFLSRPLGWSAWLERSGIGGVDANRGLRFSHADHALDAAVDGAGVVLGRACLALNDLANGRLIAPFDKMMKSDASFYLCCLPQALETPKVQKFRQFVLNEFAEDNRTRAHMLKGQQFV